VERACEGKVAIVTGASRGIGEAIARRLAEEGARVAISARTLEPDPRYEGSLVETAEAIRAAGGEAMPIQCDISKADDRRRLVAETEAQLGPVEILVNNAAVTFLLPYEDFPEKRFRLMVEVQLWAPYELGQLVVPGMRRRGEGWILNISSRAASHPAGPPFDEIHKGGFSLYGTVKAGLNRLTTALAAELYDDGIAVNSLAPWDNVATPGAGHHALVDGFRLEGPQYMAEAALVLCSTPTKQLTGRVTYSQPLLEELGIRPGERSAAPIAT
jgi:citronellol/citronellal dehydrogenase